MAPRTAPAAPPMTAEEVMARVDQAKPDVFPAVVAGKIDAGTVSASCFNLIDVNGERLATLGKTVDGWCGFALFRPGSDRAGAELILEAAGPTLRLNNTKGQTRLQLHVGADGEPRVMVMGPRGKLRLALLTERDRPRVVIFPRGTREAHFVTGAALGKMPTPKAAWARAVRALQANRRARFDAAALDAGFIGPQLDRLWTRLRRRIRQRAGKSRKRVAA